MAASDNESARIAMMTVATLFSTGDCPNVGCEVTLNCPHRRAESVMKLTY